MLKYILRRFVYMVITLWLIATITFFLTMNLPGNPFGESFERVPQEYKQILYAQYGLDKPMYVQYFKFLGNALKGDFGVSFQFPAQSVTSIIKQAFPASLELGIWATCLSIVVGLILGIIAALRHNKWQDYSAMFLAIIGVSIPSFVLGPLFSYYIGVKLGWFPPGLWKGPSYRVLPTLALSLSTIAILARLMRTSMLDILNMDYIKTAKSKGLSGFAITAKHTIRNAILPVVTIMGPIFVNVITGSFIIEKIFSVPGLGMHFVNSISSKDITMIAGLTVFYSAILVLVLFVTDILYAFVDPRIRLGKEGK